MTEKENTPSQLESVVSQLLRDKRYSKAAKKAAGLGLADPLTPGQVVPANVRQAVRKFLQDSRYSKAAKKAAGLTMADPIDDHD